MPSCVPDVIFEEVNSQRIPAKYFSYKIVKFVPLMRVKVLRYTIPWGFVSAVGWSASIPECVPVCQC